MARPSPATIASTVSVGDHKHCEMCGKAIALDGRVCSPECVARFDDMQRRKKRGMLMFVGAIALVLLYTRYSAFLFGA